MNENENEDRGQAPDTYARQLRTITLVEQVDSLGRTKWVLIEGSSTIIGLDEPNLLHALSQQVFGMQTHITRSVYDISLDAFHAGHGAGRFEGASEERARASRARVEAEEKASKERVRARLAKKRIVKKTAEAPKKSNR